MKRYEKLDQSDIIYTGNTSGVSAIRNMPFSTLSDAEWARILVIMETKLGNDAFERRFKGL